MLPPQAKPEKRRFLIFDVLLVIVLLAGAYFRFVGLDWGEYQYLHPDERFFVWVGSDIQPIGTPQELLGPPPTTATQPWRAAYPEAYPDCEKWGGYFDASCSPLNPNNRGHGFYVYGTLPMFVARYLVEWIFGNTGFMEMTDIGRPLAAIADLLTVMLVYLIASRQYNRRVGILAAAFSAAAVLQIQLSHYFTTEPFMNFFTYLAVYFAIRLVGEKWPNFGAQSPAGITQLTVDGDRENQEAAYLPSDHQPSTVSPQLATFFRSPFFWLSAAFGVALGCAVASKLNAAPVAVMLPAAFLLALLRVPPEERPDRLWQAVLYLSLAAAVSLLVFRICQPYAFSGPGFFGLKPNPQWVANIQEQRNQATGDVDFPPALQWARRPVWFSAQNLALWGLGLPLAMLSAVGFLWAGWRMLADRSPDRTAWMQHGLLWAWTGFYFVWQSLAFNPTMRYQLPIYPALAIFAAWALISLYDHRQKVAELTPLEGTASRPPAWPRILAVIAGAGVLAATYAWAYAFSQIYVRPITRVAASRWIYQNVPGPINLHIQTAEGLASQPLPFPNGFTILSGAPYEVAFTPKHSGVLKEVSLGFAVDAAGTSQSKSLSLEVSQVSGGGTPVAARLASDFAPDGDLRGQPYTFTIDQPLVLDAQEQYRLVLTYDAGLPGSAGLELRGSRPAVESTWDDGLPLRLDGYDGYGGIYEPGINFEMYWPDDADKYSRFVEGLDQADYIFISSNRQWGTTTRVPERYPLTSQFYRSLLGCPAEKEIIWCYNVAQVGAFQGELGFELAAVFDSSPRLGPLVFNSQFADEAFTVYDHPKVFIFRKAAGYNPVRPRQILGAVDLSRVVYVTPRRTGAYPADLMLPVVRWEGQQRGGTWSELFDAQAFYNRYPALGALIWYLALAVLGWIVYPLLRLALPGLPDKGYPLARAAGLLLLAYLVWLGGSLSLPVTRQTITAALALLLGASLVAAVLRWDDLRQELSTRRRYFLIVELLFLAFFVLDLLIRFANPDLWHQWKGGEKPMDFAYFNAVLKSTTFPPYDPWFAGGYLNYYYYGFVYVGMLVKWLGIVPSVAYNLILPSIFAMIALGAFSIAWNVFSGRWAARFRTSIANRLHPLIPGLAAALGMALLGNLGTVRMIFQGYQRLVAPGGVIEDAGVLTRWVWALRGMLMAFGGTSLPYSLGDWYWNPSRAIPAPGDVEPITEFPFFTVLYGDPHAHLFAIPIALLALAWALSVVLGRGWKKGGALSNALAGLLLGGLAVGALRPTNTWDFYPYLALGSVAVFYALVINDQPYLARLPGFRDLPGLRRRLFVAGIGTGLFLLLSFLLYQPYAGWYGQGYTEIGLWQGTHTPLTAYLTHWGLFLFVIVTWMAWETIEWMASTPASSLRKLEPYQGTILSAGLLLLAGVIMLSFLKAGIAWLVLPLAAWAGVLILRPGQPEPKRFVLFLVGTGLSLTLMVEVIVLKGDVGRMNTVFKFYLQVWSFFAVSAAAALGWLLAGLPAWRPRPRLAFQSIMIVLVAGAALFPLLGATAKIKDRMTEAAPPSLDGMEFMKYSQYAETWGVMDLSQDYRAIRWMQENVHGSPVIVEANQRNLYRWGSRFSIYTGLPGVVGWEWHQQQQRALLPPDWVTRRIEEINDFYITPDVEAARLFLQKYNVGYIIVGQIERGKFNSEGPDNFVAPEGLAKFAAGDGRYWKAVYQDGDTVIYEVTEDCGCSITPVDTPQAAPTLPAPVGPSP